VQYRLICNANPNMSSTHSFPAARVYRAYWQDGSIDLFAGLGATLIGVAWVTDTVALGTVAPALTIPVWMAFRRRFVEPRLGHVRFDAARRKRMRRAHVVLIALGCATFLLGVAGYFIARGGPANDEWVRAVVPALPAALIGVGSMLVALMFSLPRFALYGAAFLAAGVVGASLGAEPGWSLLAGGCVTTFAGCTLLARFVREYPSLPSELE